MELADVRIDRLQMAVQPMRYFGVEAVVHRNIRIIEDSPRTFIDAEFDAALPQTVVIAHPTVKEQTKRRQVIQGVY